MPDNLPNWSDLVKNFGVPGAMLLALLFGVLKKWVLPGWALNDQIARNIELKQDYTARLEEMRKEKDMWRDTALEHAKLASRAVTAVEVAATQTNPTTRGG